MLVNHVGIIEDAMQMNMPFIGMDGKEVLVLIAEELFAYLPADLHRLFGRDFPRLKADDKVLCKGRTSACSRSCHISKVYGSFVGISTAHKGTNEPAVVGLVGGSDIG